MDTGSRRHILGIVGVLLITTVVYLPGLVAGPSFDAAVFATVGWLATEGRHPYVDVWDHKPPLIYAVHALIKLAAADGQWWTLTVAASIGATGAAALGVGWILRRRTSPAVAAVAAMAAAGAMGQYPLSLGGGLTETFAMAPIVWALAIVVSTMDGKRLALAGLLLLVAIATSLQAIPGAGSIALLVILRMGWRGIAWLVTGAAVGLVLICTVLVGIGAGPAAVDALVTYAAAYRSSSTVDAASAATAILCLLFLIVAAVLGSARLMRRQHAPRTVELGMLAWVVLTVISYVAIGRFEVHYATVGVIPLVVLAASAFHRMPRQLDRVAVPLVTGLGFLMSFTVSASASAPLIAAYAAENGRVARAAEAVRQLAPVDSTIVVWGLEPHIHTESEREPAGRFVYLYPLTTPGYTDEAQILGELASWERSRPALIIDAGSLAPGLPGAPPLLLERPTDFDGRDLDLLGPLRSFVHENYRLILNIDGWPVYQLSDS